MNSAEQKPKFRKFVNAFGESLNQGFLKFHHLGWYIVLAVYALSLIAYLALIHREDLAIGTFGQNSLSNAWKDILIGNDSWVFVFLLVFCLASFAIVGKVFLELLMAIVAGFRAINGEESFVTSDEENSENNGESSAPEQQEDSTRDDDKQADDEPEEGNNPTPTTTGSNEESYTKTESEVAATVPSEPNEDPRKLAILNGASVLEKKSGSGDGEDELPEAPQMQPDDPVITETSAELSSIDVDKLRSLLRIDSSYTSLLETTLKELRSKYRPGAKGKNRKVFCTKDFIILAEGLFYNDYYDKDKGMNKMDVVHGFLTAMGIAVNEVKCEYQQNPNAKELCKRMVPFFDKLSPKS